jgi:acetolactate synthase I/II/III large subunit
MKQATYSDQFCDWLVENGYTHCFFVAGGNIMHILNSARKRFKCIPVIHEVAASIAVEYFNETANGKKSFALVTAGPGLTNCITGIAGAWLESRELLVIGGQVKGSDLATEGIRQRGIQEIQGIALTESITKDSLQIVEPVSKAEVDFLIRKSRNGRPGPVFIEFCLDAQGAPMDSALAIANSEFETKEQGNQSPNLENVLESLSSSERPIILIGGGVSREIAELISGDLIDLKIPVMTTWNAMDRVDSKNELYWGRPNTWGQRYSNVLIQQADLIISVGSRLGIQQTGFNWESFAKNATLVQVDIDEAELSKSHPNVDIAVKADAGQFLLELMKSCKTHKLPTWDSWREFGQNVRDFLPTNETCNNRTSGYINPFDFVELLSSQLTSKDVVIPCSSGGAFTTMMQTFNQKYGQKIVTNKALASMGYGLSGAIGASFANPDSKVILVEGDGGFSQNLQELGTVSINKLPIKMFIYSNGGYASIRMTQANYFDSEYVGCDESTGLGMPEWLKLFSAYSIRVATLNPQDIFSADVLDKLNDSEPCAFIVPIDPEQTYFPKITSSVLPDGKMQSNPLHLMTPELSEEVASKVFKYL